MKRFVIYGAGGCGRDIHAAVSRSCEQLDNPPAIVFCDDAAAGGQVCETSVIARSDIRSDDHVILAVADSRARETIAKGLSPFSFFAATALISDQANIGTGAVISDMTIINHCTIGRHFQANYQCYVAHDCVIGDFVTFAPAVRCNGNVTIGDHAYIGCGAMIRQGVSIGAGAVVGMGAVVVEDVPAGAVVMGNPAHRQKS